MDAEVRLMNQRILADGAFIRSGVSRTNGTTDLECEVRELLGRNTTEDTARAKKRLRGIDCSLRGAEWWFLMRICALRQGYVADAQAYLDRARHLCPTEPAYNALYNSVRDEIYAQTDSEDDTGHKRRFRFDAWDAGNCCECCCDLSDCHDGGCNCFDGGCNCCDGDCNCCDGL